eukprot:200906_1
MSSFLRRKDYLARNDRLSHAVRERKEALFNEILSQNATLLVVDGRHTIFDSVPFSERMVQSLMQNNVAFIASEHHHHTLNVIRPHFIRFVQELQQMSRPSPFHLKNALILTEERMNCSTEE